MVSVCLGEIRRFRRELLSHDDGSNAELSMEANKQLSWPTQTQPFSKDIEMKTLITSCAVVAVLALFAGSVQAGGCGYGGYGGYGGGYCAPTYCAPTYCAPVIPYCAPTYVAPTYCAPTYCAPTYFAPTYCAPTYCAPTYPVYGCHQPLLTGGYLP